MAYTIVNAEGDARTQQTQAEQAITAGAKVILLVNLDSGSGAAIIAMAREAGVAVMDYDRLTVEGPGADVYVSFDNVQVGRTIGRVLEPMINAQQGTPRVVLLNGVRLIICQHAPAGVLEVANPIRIRRLGTG